MHQTIKQKWYRWKVDLKNKIEVPRLLVFTKEQIKAVDVYVFGDASISG